MCITCWPMPVEAGELWIPRTGLTGACEPYDMGAGKANLGPLQKQQMLLTTKPSLRPKTGFLYQVSQCRVFLGPRLVDKALGFRKYFFSFPLSWTKTVVIGRLECYHLCYSYRSFEGFFGYVCFVLLLTL